MKVFSIIAGKSRIEFSMWRTVTGFEARVNDVVFFSSADYLDVSDAVNEGMEANTFAYIGGMTH